MVWPVESHPTLEEPLAEAYKAYGRVLEILRYEAEGVGLEVIEVDRSTSPAPALTAVALRTLAATSCRLSARSTVALFTPASTFLPTLACGPCWAARALSSMGWRHAALKPIGTYPGTASCLLWQAVHDSL